MVAKKHTKAFWRIMVFSLTLSLLIAPLRSSYFKIGSISGFQLSSIVGFFVYYCLTIWLLNKTSDKQSKFVVIGGILVGMSLINLSIRIIFYSSTQASLLEYFIHLLAIPGGYIWYKIKKTRLKIFIAIVFSIIGLWLSIFGYRMWLNKLNFGTFTGKIENGYIQEMFFQKSNGDTISLNDYKGKYLVLDCWITSCGICYKKFPAFQELYNKYKNNQEVMLAALHCRIENNSRNNKETSSTGAEILKKRNFVFPCLSIDGENSKLTEIGVKVYPTVLIFNKNSQLIYKGNIEGATSMVKKLVNSNQE